MMKAEEKLYVVYTHFVQGEEVTEFIKTIKK